MNKKIIWEKWRDPTTALVPGASEPEEDDVEARSSRDLLLEDEPSHEPSKKRGGFGPAVVGPMGIIPLHEHNLPSKLFNFWMGHCNFDLSGKVINVVKRVAGVETLDVFSRYRFRLGIARGFVPAIVRGDFEDAACGRKAVADLKTLLRDRYSHWAVLELHGGRLEVAGGDSPAEVQNRIGPLLGQAKEVHRSW